MIQHQHQYVWQLEWWQRETQQALWQLQQQTFDMQRIIAQYERYEQCNGHIDLTFPGENGIRDSGIAWQAQSRVRPTQ